MTSVPERQEIVELLDAAADAFHREAEELWPAADVAPVEELTGIDQDLADMASDTMEREVARGLRSEVDDLLEEIEAARRRLAADRFGSCERCGEPIARERLRAIPWTRFCTRDQAANETGFTPPT